MFQPNKKSRRKARRLIVLLLSVVLITSTGLSLVACGGNTASESSGTETSGAEDTAVAIELQIFAANSLEKALPEIQALYTEQNPTITFLDTQFKGSGDLVTELQGGAPADILITASTGTMDTASENGNIDDATRVNMFQNDLIIVRQAGSDVIINDLADVNSSDITKVAIGDADAVPAGAYANQSLFSIGLYTDDSGKGGQYEAGFGDKVIPQSSVGNVAQTVATGDAQIGFVYTSDLYRYEGIEEAFVVPADSHKKIIYPGAVVSGSEYADEAAEFIDFCLNDPDALKIWTAYGFEVTS